jgi:hypothetical protein
MPAEASICILLTPFSLKGRFANDSVPAPYNLHLESCAALLPLPYGLSWCLEL